MGISCIQAFYVPDGTFNQISTKIYNLIKNNDYITGDFLVQNIDTRLFIDFYICLRIDRLEDNKELKYLYLTLVEKKDDRIKIDKLPYEYTMSNSIYYKEDIDNELVEFFEYITKICKWIMMKRS